MCHSSGLHVVFYQRRQERRRLKHRKKKKRTEEIRWRVSVDSLLLFAFASLSARPFQTPASRSPGGTPPSSASRAGTPRSCHTCRGKDMYDITVLARPLKFTLPVHV